MLEKEKKEFYLRIALMALAFVLLMTGSFVFKSWWLKIPMLILAGVVGALLVRIGISYRRKKFYFEGKVLSVIPPKKKLGRHAVIIKNGKVSKKLYALQKPNMKVGGLYGVYFEEKSLEILKSEPLKVQLLRGTKAQSTPQMK